MTRQLGIAVIGLGIGEQHARMYATQPSCDVKLLVDLDRSRAESLATAFPGSEAASDFGDALDRDDIDELDRLMHRLERRLAEAADRSPGIAA